MKKIEQKSSPAVTLSISGASVAGIAAAYFFLGPKGQKNREHTKAWAIRMKGDVVEKLEKTKSVSESVYHEIVDSVAEEYTKGKKAGGKEISALANDLKKHWSSLTHSVKRARRDISKGSVRIAKKAGL